MDRNEMSKRIVEIEMIIQNAIWKGHRCSFSDEYQPLRIEQNILRCLYYGTDSPYCKLKK